MRSSLRPTLLVLPPAVAVALGVVALHPSGDNAVLAKAVAGVVLVLWLRLELVVHEGAHLVVALLLGLRVRGVRLFGRTVFGAPTAQSRNNVTVDLLRPRRLLVPRVVLMKLAGPAADLGFAAAAAGVVLDPARPVAFRVAAVSVCAAAGWTGLLNLLPLPGVSTHQDGVSALRWARTWRRRMSELADQRTVAALPRVGVASADSAGTTTADEELGALRAAAGSDRGAVAGPAAARLLVTLARRRGPDARAAIWDDYDLFLHVARLPDLPAGAVGVAPIAAQMLAENELRLMLQLRRQPEPRTLERLAALAEAGHAAAPNLLRARITLALVRGLQDRCDESRNLLVGIESTGAPPNEVAVAYAVRALSELDLGERKQALRLVAAAERAAPQEWMVQVARLRVDAGPSETVSPDCETSDRSAGC